MIDYDELAQEAHRAAVAKGFWDNPVSDEQAIVLVISELMEAVEAARNNRHADEYAYEDELRLYGDMKTSFEKNIKDTLENEIADVVIRICDLTGERGVPILGVYEWTWKDDFAENIYECCAILTKPYCTLRWKLGMVIAFCEYIAEEYDFDLAWHIREKMKYNETRPRLNGKIY